MVICDFRNHLCLPFAPGVCLFSSLAPPRRGTCQCHVIGSSDHRFIWRSGVLKFGIRNFEFGICSVLCAFRPPLIGSRSPLKLPIADTGKYVTHGIVCRLHPPLALAGCSSLMTNHSPLLLYCVTRGGSGTADLPRCIGVLAVSGSISVAANSSASRPLTWACSKQSPMPPFPLRSCLLWSSAADPSLKSFEGLHIAVLFRLRTLFLVTRHSPRITAF